MNKIVLALFVLLTQGLSAVFASPSLFFSKTDLPILRERIKQAPYDKYWDNLIKHANAYCDPNNKEYLDPNTTILEFSKTGWYTRRLTARVEVLGFCYQMTGDRRYAQKVKDLLLASIKLANYTNDVGKARCKITHVTYAVGLDWCGDIFTPMERKQVVDISRAYIEALFKLIEEGGAWWYPYHNYMGVDGGGIGLLALALDQDLPKESKEWAKKAADMETLWFSKGFDIGGAYFEGSGYMQFGLSDALMFSTAYKTKTGIDLLQHPMIKNIPDFLLMSVLPGDNVFDARNDMNYQGMDEIYMLALVRYLKNPNLTWLWEHRPFEGSDYNYPRTTGMAPWRIIWDYNNLAQAPNPQKNKLSACYKERGLCVWRTGWDKDDLMFSIESGPYHSVTHNQADKGHFTLYSHGYRWACDAGYGNSREPNGRAQTLAHSCILVDGKGQALTGAALGTNGKIVSYEDNDKFGYALVDNTEAYNHNITNSHHENSSSFASYQLEKIIQPMKGIGVEHALRYSVFFKKEADRPAYVVVFDDIKKDNDSHAFTWQQITWQDINISYANNVITLKPKKTESAGPEYSAMIYAKEPITIAQDVYAPGDKRKPESFPRVKVTTKAVNPYFTAVLMVLEPGQAKPAVTYTSKADSTVISVEWRGETDRITFYQENKKEPDILITNRNSL